MSRHTDLLAREMWGLQQRGQNDALIAFACYMSGINDFFREDYIRARGYFEDGLRRRQSQGWSIPGSGS